MTYLITPEIFQMMMAFANMSINQIEIKWLAIVSF